MESVSLKEKKYPLKALKAFQKHYKWKSYKIPISKQPRFVSSENLIW